jgi:hypothetical protein
MIEMALRTAVDRSQNRLDLADEYVNIIDNFCKEILNSGNGNIDATKKQELTTLLDYYKAEIKKESLVQWKKSLSNLDSYFDQPGAKVEDESQIKLRKNLISNLDSYFN